MKRQLSFMFKFFILGTMIAVAFILFSYFYIENDLLKETSNSLIVDAEFKAERIDDYLSKIKRDIKGLQESDEVKKLLREDLIVDEETVKKDVEKKARIISRRIENYLFASPQNSLEDLRKSPKFNEIAIQPIGKESYTDINELETYKFLFSNSPYRLDLNIHENPSEYKELIEILNKLNNGADTFSGFYNWYEPNGSKRMKYGSFNKIPIPTSDGINLLLGAAVYPDNYRCINMTSTYLQDFKKNEDYFNLILISPEGYVFYMADKQEVLGTNLEWKVNLEEGLSRAYFEVKENKEISFYGPFIEDYGDIYPKISVMAPVYDEGTLLGYVALVDYMDDIFEITNNVYNLKSTGQSYLVNDERLLISPLRNGEFDIMVQSVRTENIDECVEDLDEKGEDAFEEEYIEKKEEGDLRTSENYEGDRIIGTDFPFPDLRWCLLVEIYKTEAIDDELEILINRRIYFSLIAIFVFTIIGIFIGKYFDKKEKKKK